MSNNIIFNYIIGDDSKIPNIPNEDILKLFETMSPDFTKYILQGFPNIPDSLNIKKFRILLDLKNLYRKNYDILEKRRNCTFDHHVYESWINALINKLKEN
jgi:hypothetical protein